MLFKAVILPIHTLVLLTIHMSDAVDKNQRVNLNTASGCLTCGGRQSGNILCVGTNVSELLGGGINSDAWEFTVQQAGEFRFDTCGSQTTTRLQIFRHKHVGTFDAELVYSCDSCGECGGQAQLSVQLDAGEYWVVIHGTSETECGAEYSISVLCPESSRPAPLKSTYSASDGYIQCGTSVALNGNDNVQQDSYIFHPLERSFIFLAEALLGEYQIGTCGSSENITLYLFVYNESDRTVGRMVETIGVDSRFKGDTCGDGEPGNIFNIPLSQGSYLVIIERATLHGAGVALVHLGCHIPYSIPQDIGAICSADTSEFINSSTTVGGTQYGSLSPSRVIVLYTIDPLKVTFDTCGSDINTNLHIYESNGMM